jgi:hypothetical protein
MQNLLENAVNTRPTTMSVVEFCKSNDLTEIVPKIRVNSNGYPYVTFINSDNVATNIYFTVNASDTVSEGQDLREIASDLQIVFVKNELGEDRIKLSRKSTSRLTVDNLFS